MNDKFKKSNATLMIKNDTKENSDHSKMPPIKLFLKNKEAKRNDLLIKAPLETKVINISNNNTTTNKSKPINNDISNSKTNKIPKKQTKVVSFSDNLVEIIDIESHKLYYIEDKLDIPPKEIRQTKPVHCRCTVF